MHDTRVDSTLTRSATADAEITAGEHTPAAEASLRASDSPWMDTLDIEDLNDHREPKRPPLCEGLGDQSSSSRVKTSSTRSGCHPTCLCLVVCLLRESERVLGIAD